MSSSPACVTDEGDEGRNFAFKFQLQRSHANMEWKMFCFLDEGERFYVKSKYFSDAKLFVIHVSLADKSSIAEKYVVNISVSGSGTKKIMMTTNVDSLVNMPQNEKEFLVNGNCLMLPIHQLTAMIKTTSDENENEWIGIKGDLKIIEAEMFNECIGIKGELKKNEAEMTNLEFLAILADPSDFEEEEEEEDDDMGFGLFE